MANIAAVLKEEITRLVRKELRGETESLRKTNSRYRTETAALKKRVTILEQHVTRLEKTLAKLTPAEPTKQAPTKHRFNAKRFQALRAKLQLSAADFGRLIGVSTQTIYNWESGQSRPKPEQLPVIVALRKMGKRALKERLETLKQT